MKPVLLSEIESFFNAKAFKKEQDFLLLKTASIEKTSSMAISFWTAEALPLNLMQIQVGLLFVPMNYKSTAIGIRSFLKVEDPYQAMVSFIEHFYLPFLSYPPKKVALSAEVHSSAVVEGEVGEHCRIGPGCVVSKGTKVGDRTVLEANITLYPGVSIGADCKIQAGVVIGSRGFGFYLNNGIRFPVPHIAGVSIGNNCELGANMVVAAGFLSPTQIGDDCYFDSFVQIGHNCTLGNRIYMASQSGLGGSTIVEDGVEFGGGAQVAGHLTIQKEARIAAKAGVTKNVARGVTVSGFPAVDINSWRKQVLFLRKMGRELK